MRAGALALAALAGLAVVLGADAGTGDPPNGRVAAERPNVVVIVTDDQRAETLRVMTRVRRLLGKEGATFRRSYVNFALCCPSRASLLTGEYAHNHGVLGNTPPEGGFEVFQELHGSSNLATWLHDAGYWTALVGKYFNGYGEDDPRFVPAGWDEWIASTPPGQRVYDYTLNHDGRLIERGSSPADFKEDVLSDAAVRVIARRAPAEQPFFLTLAYTAPHVGGPKVSQQPPHDCTGAAKPAPRYAHAFDSARLPTPPGFDEANVSDKPPGVRNLSRIGPSERRDLVRTYRCYLESLLAVDDGVGRIVAELRRQGALADTLIVFTSDNGLFFGEHRILTGKVRHYEPASRVPLVMRGPGVRPRTRVGEPVMNVDLAPTILEATGAVSPDPVDGRSLLPLAAGNGAPSRDLLLESRTFAAVRSARYVYVEHVAGAARGASELYDLRSDPGELRDLAALRRFAALRRRLALRLDELRDCAGADCRAAPPGAARG